MRITGGTLRGRALRAPEGLTTRPTADRVREALFNILMHHEWPEEIGNPLRRRYVLDAFAGTGGLGLEALSRGASSCFFFEKDRSALRCLQENVSAMEVDEAAHLFSFDVTKPPIATHEVSLVFFDPPYRKGLIERAYAALTAQGWLAPVTLLVCETAKQETISLPDTCELILSRTYGDTDLSFFVARITLS